MTDPLYGVKLKQQRARDLLNALNSDVSTFIKKKAYGLRRATEPVLYPIPQGGFGEALQIIYEERLPSPPMWGIRVGEIIYNWRSALDQLVWQLVFRETGQPPTTMTQFPICDAAESYDKDTRIRKTQLAGASEPAMKLVRSVQPFSMVDEGGSPLSHLRILSNWDKHNNIILATSYANDRAIEHTADPNTAGIIISADKVLRHGVALGALLAKGSARDWNPKWGAKLDRFLVFDTPAELATKPFTQTLLAIGARVEHIVHRAQLELF